MFATETGELVRYSNVVRRGTILNTIMVLMTIPSVISAFLATRVLAWVVTASFAVNGFTIIMYFLLMLILTSYTYLQYIPGLVCSITFAMAVITAFYRSSTTLSLLIILLVVMFITFAVMTGLSWSRRLLETRLQSRMMPVIYTSK